MAFTDQPGKPKVPLSSILPLPQVQKTAAASDKAKKPFMAFVNTSETLSFVRSKDSLLKEKEQTVLRRLQLAEHSSTTGVSSTHFNEPVPATKGKIGWECAMCLGLCGHKDCLEEDPHWATCRNCGCHFHYGCIRVSKMCLCGQIVRLKRIAKQEN